MSFDRATLMAKREVISLINYTEEEANEYIKLVMTGLVGFSLGAGVPALSGALSAIPTGLT